MHIAGIGINGNTDDPRGRLSPLEDHLDYVVSCGFDVAELMITCFDVIIGGRLRQQRVDQVQAITERFDLAYTVHAPLRLNLAFPQSWPGYSTELSQEKDVFVACLDFCAAIGASVLVYHSGLIALHQTAFGLSPLPDDAVLEQARAQEVTSLQELLPLAAERGVLVAMENRDPHLWEVATLMRNGLSPDQLLTYHAGMSIPALVRQVQAVNHPNFGLTLDFGHLFLTANYCRFDYLEAIREAAPYVRHLHSSDNFGRLGGVFSELRKRIPYGDGDVHIPPGWGEIPHREALAQLPDYDGFYILELNARCQPYFPEALETVRQLINQVQGGEK
jgi:sugar phosphate isomerase/epimerase